jgi:predicted transcriptional regulator
MTSFELFDLAEENLKSFARSSVRAKIILSLIDRDLALNELEKLLNIRASTMLHAIKDMIEEGLIRKINHEYSLTNVGRIQALLLDELISTIAALEQHRDFWMTHDIGGIPVDLQLKIGMLAESYVLKDDHSAPLRSLEYFVEQLVNSSVIRGLSPVIITGWSEAIALPVRNGSSVELILTNSVLETVIRERGALLKELLGFDNFKLYRLKDGAKAAFTVTENFLNLGLCRPDGSYDLASDLICSGEKAVNWGNELFDYYLSCSERVNTIN